MRIDALESNKIWKKQCANRGGIIILTEKKNVQAKVVYYLFGWLFDTNLYCVSCERDASHIQARENEPYSHGGHIVMSDWKSVVLPPLTLQWKTWELG